MKKLIFAALIGATTMMTACTGATENTVSEAVISENAVSKNEVEDSASSNEASADAESVSDNEAEKSDKVAEAAPEAAVEIDYDSLVPVYKESIKDGVYENVQVDCSSSMFVIDSCKVTKEGDTMVAELTMGGKGYLYVYPGTGDEAANASEEDYINYTENEDGSHVYTFEINAFDEPFNLAAYSKKKELWYERVLVFRASSLGMDAYEDGVVTTVDQLDVEDGTYTCEVELAGGSGKAYIESPATVVIENGKATATIVWSSPNYDYMLIGDVKYEPVNEDGNSTFVIPVECFDYAFPVKGDTTAMSTPHEIDYTLEFSSELIAK